MSSSTLPQTGESSGSPAAKTSRPRRGTLQSGFSLLSRGEPKIWLTGGMLVICLAMIVGLLGLIVINGLATFWPGPLDWLILTNNQLDVGEPQSVEYGKPRDAQAASAATETVLPDGSPAPRVGEQPSRFYRTANFDITGRHYRWFEPQELDQAGIVRPEWALVVERLSWGRMLALPSRLSLPAARIAEAETLTGMLATEALIQELSGELEGLAATRAVDAAAPEASADRASAVAEEAPLARLTATLASEIERARSQQLKEAISERLQQQDGRVLMQAVAGAPWSLLESTEQLQPLESIAAARVVWDEPAEILEHIEPVIGELADKRRQIKHLMQTISRLDRRLSDARVSVRQAELDTGRAGLTQADSVGPLVETVVNLERLEQRLKDSAARALQDFKSQPEQAEQWRGLASTYQQQRLAPALETASAALDAWRQQFAAQPPEIQSALDEFEATWRDVLERKQPLEKEIQKLQAASEGFDLGVLVPGEPPPAELSPSEWEELQQGRWPESVLAALAAQGFVPLADSIQRTQFNPRVMQLTFVDLAQGRQSLWCLDDGRACLLTPQRTVNCNEIVRIYPANRLGVFGKLAVYGARWREFLLDDPREANTEGGVFPAIWGTIVMTLIMTLAVVPFGVIAALYLREYTRSGPIVSLVRISINNLAGVPSIVYGVFGLAFFCYTVGAFIDGGAKNAEIGTLPGSTWYLVLGLTVLVGVVAFFFSLLSNGNRHSPKPIARWLARVAPLLWLLSLVGVGVLVFKNPFFNGFYEARLPSPTFGKEGLIWASLTLALLTLPVVIVATEEALAAVPNSLREGSLACGASKWQTIHRIVLPHARPGILTGAILAMARGIGEVAPLMLVGALPVAPDLPLDTEFPYFHGSRSFMHLGYQIYWLGFQSQNSEASKPLVFTCTLLLLLIVVALNLSAILLRARLRRRFQGNQF